MGSGMHSGHEPLVTLGPLAIISSETLSWSNIRQINRRDKGRPNLVGVSRQVGDHSQGPTRADAEKALN